MPPAVSRDVRSRCPDCLGALAVMRVMNGRAGCQYWAQRCIRCGGVHLDIVNPGTSMPEDDGAPAA
jgi:hypothetical protein